jgi:hypothetical protein
MFVFDIVSKWFGDDERNKWNQRKSKTWLIVFEIGRFTTRKLINTNGNTDGNIPSVYTDGITVGKKI